MLYIHVSRLNCKVRRVEIWIGPNFAVENPSNVSNDGRELHRAGVSRALSKAIKLFQFLDRLK